MMRRMPVTRAVSVLALCAAIAAPAAAALAFNDYFKPPDGAQGTAYDFQFRARAGCDPVYYYSMLRGSLPPGLVLSQAGRITGTPTSPGVYQFTAQLESYYNGCTSYPSQRDFSIGIAPPRFAVAGVPYSVSFGSSREGTQTWSVASGQLPPGLTFSPDGTLAGTPTTIGTYSWSVRLDDASDTHPVTLEVDRKLTLVSNHSVTGEVGAPLSVDVAAAGGTPPYAWARTGGALPAGITFAGHTISGTPRVGGSFRGRFTVTDAHRQTATVTVSLALKSRLELKTHHLGPARAYRPYRVKLRTTGGVPPFAWTATGKLPTGIRLDRRAGALSGVTRTTGRFPLKVALRDALGKTSKVSFVLTVSK
jgi:Putative Ig domain